MDKPQKIAALAILGVLVVTGILVVVLNTNTPSSSSTSPGGVAEIGNLTKTTAPAPFQSMLTMTVSLGSRGTCGGGGYSDIREGAQVEIVNQKNEVLAVGRLSNSGPDCQFWSLIEDIPPGEKMYGAKLGNANRGVIWKTESEARSGGWALTLGD